MRYLPLIFISFTAFAYTQDFPITGWREVQNLSEKQAARMAYAALEQELEVNEDGMICGLDEVWGFEREKELIADFPEKRGEIFGIAGYVRGPHSQHGCSGTQTYDCRVVFSRPPNTKTWNVEYTECELAGTRGQD